MDNDAKVSCGGEVSWYKPHRRREQDVIGRCYPRIQDQRDRQNSRISGTRVEGRYTRTRKQNFPPGPRASCVSL